MLRDGDPLQCLYRAVFRGGQGAAAPQGKCHPKKLVHIFLGKAKYFITVLTTCKSLYRRVVERLNCFFITT
jgi:hypothetical protein